MAVRNIDISNILSLFLFGLLLSAVLNYRRESSQVISFTHCKIIFFTIAFLVINTVSLAMVLYGTGYDRNSIGGIQGRYFLPVLPIILLFFGNKAISNKKRLNQEIIVSAVLLNVLVLINVSYILIK